MQHLLQTKAILTKAMVSKRTKHQDFHRRTLKHRTTTNGQNQVILQVQAIRKLQFTQLLNLMLVLIATTRATHHSLPQLTLVIRPMAKLEYGHNNMRKHLISQINMVPSVDKPTASLCWILKPHPPQQPPTSPLHSLRSNLFSPVVL